MIVITMAFGTLLAAAACSRGGSDSDSGGDFNQALREYESASTSQAEGFAETVATAHLQKLEAVGNGGSETATQVLFQVMKDFENDGSSTGESLCQRLKPVIKDAGDGDREQERIDEARELSDDLVEDAMATALIKKALASPPENQDRLLGLLGIYARSSAGEDLVGLAALKEVGLVDEQGNFALPERGSEPHNSYTKWKVQVATGFQQTIDGLTAKAALISPTWE